MCVKGDWCWILQAGYIQPKPPWENLWSSASCWYTVYPPIISSESAFRTSRVKRWVRKESAFILSNNNNCQQRWQSHASTRPQSGSDWQKDGCAGPLGGLKSHQKCAENVTEGPTRSCENTRLQLQKLLFSWQLHVMEPAAWLRPRQTDRQTAGWQPVTCFLCEWLSSQQSTSTPETTTTENTKWRTPTRKASWSSTDPFSLGNKDLLSLRRVPTNLVKTFIIPRIVVA